MHSELCVKIENIIAEHNRELENKTNEWRSLWPFLCFSILHWMINYYLLVVLDSSTFTHGPWTIRLHLNECGLELHAIHFNFDVRKTLSHTKRHQPIPSNSPVRFWRMPQHFVCIVSNRINISPLHSNMQNVHFSHPLSLFRIRLNNSEVAAEIERLIAKRRSSTSVKSSDLRIVYKFRHT